MLALINKCLIARSKIKITLFSISASVILSHDAIIALVSFGCFTRILGSVSFSA
jgi:hypothetical protein